MHLRWWLLIEENVLGIIYLFEAMHMIGVRKDNGRMDNKQYHL